MRRFYALGVLVATAVAAMLGLKVTEARAYCPVPTCGPEGELRFFSCESDRCEEKDPNYLCGVCVPVQGYLTATLGCTVGNLLSSMWNMCSYSMSSLLETLRQM